MAKVYELIDGTQVVLEQYQIMYIDGTTQTVLARSQYEAAKIARGDEEPYRVVR